jgi:hypothetical protein
MENLMEYQLLKAPSDDLGRLQDQLNSLAIEGWRVFSMVIESLEAQNQSFPSGPSGSNLIVLLERSQQGRAYFPSSSK